MAMALYGRQKFPALQAHGTTEHRSRLRLETPCAIPATANFVNVHPRAGLNDTVWLGRFIHATE
jgi:hypothetical protein